MKKIDLVLILFLFFFAGNVIAEDDDTQHKANVFNWYAVDMPANELSTGSSEMMAPSFFNALEKAYKDEKGHIVMDGQDVQEMDNNENGKVDMWKHMYNGQLMVIEHDSDEDGNVDVWRFYQGRSMTKMEVDRNHDGNVDMTSFYDKGQKIRMDIDQNLDGEVDRISYYADGKTYKMEWDSDYDGVMDKGFDRTELMKKRRSLQKNILQTTTNSEE